MCCQGYIKANLGVVLLNKISGKIICQMLSTCNDFIALKSRSNSNITMIQLQIKY